MSGVSVQDRGEVLSISVLGRSGQKTFYTVDLQAVRQLTSRKIRTYRVYQVLPEGEGGAWWRGVPAPAERQTRAQDLAAELAG